MNSPETIPMSEESNTPIIDGLNAEAWQAFARLLVFHGTQSSFDKIVRFDGGKRDLWFAEHSSEGSQVYHLYLYSQPFSPNSNGRLHLATLIRANEGSDHSNLRYDISATNTGGAITKHDDNGEKTPDIDDLEKTELASHLMGFLDRLTEEDPTLERRTSWVK